MLRPSTTSSLLFTGSSGARIGDSVNDVSLPVGVYLSPIAPLRTVPPGWYTVRNRFSGTAAVCALARRPWPIDLQPRQRDGDAAGALDDRSTIELELATWGLSPIAPGDKGSRRSA